MVKTGQRKFLLKNGYTHEQLDKMSPAEAKSIISEKEKISINERELFANEHIFKIFKDNYPELNALDYRPICSELFVKNKRGITIWLSNGDIIEYYPVQ